MRRFSTLLTLILLLLALSAPALAHGYIVRAIPEDRAVLERPPTRLQYWFSEDLEPDFSSMALRDQTGAVLAEGGVDPDNQALMTLRVPADLRDGAYIVELRPAFASDGHVVAESRVFFVGASVGGVESATAGYEVLPLEVVWRLLVWASTLLLFGAFVIYSGVLVPAWGSDTYRAGYLPPRLMRALNRIVIAGFVLAFGANILALLQQSMVFFNTGLAEVINGSLWSVVRIGSRFGDVWNIRMLLLGLAAVLFGLSIYLRDSQPETVRPFWTANLWVLALVIGSFSVTSHAAGSLLWPWVAIFVDWMHSLAVGVWVGGLAVLTLVLPVALRPYSGEPRRLALLAALRRFSRLAVAALLVVIATGIYSSLNWLYQPADVTQTAWGGALLVKLALVASLVALGALHHIAANPERFQRWGGRLSYLPVTLRLEALLAVPLLAAVGVLSATPVPEPYFLGSAPPAPSAAQEVNGVSANVSIIPGGPGINTFDTVLTRDGTIVPDAQVVIQVVQPEMDRRSDWQPAEGVGEGLYVTANDQIDAEGRWLTLVDVTTGDETTRFAFDWAITNEAAIIESRDPTLLNIAALGGVLLVLGYAAYPSLARFYRWLNWNPATLAVGIGATVVTLIAIGVGVVIFAQIEADYNATLNPPPQVVNPTLPDAASLATGAQLYQDACPDWAASGDLDALVERLPRLRDEELFAVTSAGWRAIPACNDTLTEPERWHIVNFIRTLRSEDL